MESLTERVLRFQRTGEDRESIIRDIACRIYDYPRRKCRWDEEAASEFFARVYPKIRGMIERFKDMGRPFESYLTSVLMFQVRTFAQQRKRLELEWRVAADPELWEHGPGVAEEGEGGDGEGPAEASGRLPPVGASPAPPDRSAGAAGWENLDPAMRELLGMDPDGSIRSAAARRRFLVVCLRSAHLLSGEDVAAVARMVGRPEQWLLRIVEGLRARGLARSGRVQLFTERRNRAFSGLRLTEIRLAREVEPERRKELERARSRLKATMASCQGIISRIRLGPSHREIAEALGMPKASVDSTLHRLKLRAAMFYPPRHEEYA